MVWMMTRSVALKLLVAKMEPRSRTGMPIRARFIVRPTRQNLNRSLGRRKRCRHLLQLGVTIRHPPEQALIRIDLLRMRHLPPLRATTPCLHLVQTPNNRPPILMRLRPVLDLALLWTPTCHPSGKGPCQALLLQGNRGPPSGMATSIGNQAKCPSIARPPISRATHTVQRQHHHQ